MKYMIILIKNKLTRKTANVDFYKSQLRGWKAKYRNHANFPTIKISQNNEEQLIQLIQ